MSKKDRYKRDNCDPGVPAWVVTYGDMMSLLLAFFVMLLSFSEVDRVKFKAFMGSMQEAFGVQKLEELIEIPEGANIVIPEIMSGGSSILSELNSIVPRSFPGSRVQEDKVGTLLIVPGRLLFESGTAELKPETRAFLQEIAELVASKPSTQLQIEGHTDNIPIKTTQFPSNWELSAGRAISVVRFLIEDSNVQASRLGAAGYADTRPLVPNNSPENRETNRRVEFLFMEGRPRITSEDWETMQNAGSEALNSESSPALKQPAQPDDSVLEPRGGERDRVP